MNDQNELIDPSNEEYMDAVRAVQEAIDSNVGETELTFSRLAFMQPGSPEVASQEPGYKIGQVVDSINREIYSDYSKPPWMVDKGIDPGELNNVHWCLLMPVFKLPTEFIKWIPRNEREPGDPLWEFKTLDAEDERVVEGCWPNTVRGGKWGTTPETKNERPPVTDNNNFLVLVIDLEAKVAKGNFIVATFSRTSSKAGRTLSNYCNGHKMEGLPYFGRCYYLHTKTESNDDGTFVVGHIAKGPRSDQAVQQYIMQMALSMGRWLAEGDPRDGPGRERQERIINAADFGVEDAEHGGKSREAPADKPGVDEGEEDPFDEDDETDPEF